MGIKTQARAEEIVNELGTYSEVEELVPCPYMVTPWGGEFEKEVEYQINVHGDHANLTFFEGMRCFRFKQFHHFPTRAHRRKLCAGRTDRLN